MHQHLVKKTWQMLVSDLNSTNHFSSGLLCAYQRALEQGIPHARAFKWPDVLEYHPTIAKRLIQARDFGKRWRFADDTNTDEDLERKTVHDFLMTQDYVQASLPSSLRVHLWLQEARVICASILGKFDEEEFYKRCRFGKRAARHVRREESHLHTKVKVMSGSTSQVRSVLPIVNGDMTLRQTLRCNNRDEKGRPGKGFTWRRAESLMLEVVPKNYKSGRTITPDTVIGSFISSGYGSYVQERLRLNGLDIRTLQETHKQLARGSSCTGHLVTADMSKASDNISWPLMLRLLPMDWLRPLRKDRIRRLSICNSTECASTVMSMGKGYTFPLQTLIFYSLLRSVANLLKVESRISVYGDDLIYPKKIHKYVATLFPQVGLKFNLDKTFATDRRMYFIGDSLQSASTAQGCFRESCGGDFLCGIDVRPYSLEAREDYSKQHGSEALCYTLLNGLLEKWKPREISRTVRFLALEIANCGGFNVVLNEDSVASGLRLKHAVEVAAVLGTQFLFHYPQAHRIEYSDFRDSYSDVLTYRRLVPRKAPVVTISPDDERIYYWDTLRSNYIRGLEQREVDLPPYAENQDEWNAPDRPQKLTIYWCWRGGKRIPVVTVPSKVSINGWRRARTTVPCL